MAKGVNKVTLLGNVGRDPEVKATAGGTLIAQFSVATADRVKQNGQWVDHTEWHNVKAFGRTAEIIRDYVHKGSQLFLEGKLQTQSWDDKQSGQKRYRTEVICNELSLLGGKSGGGQAASKSSGDGYEDGPGSYGQSYQAQDEDVPF